MKNEKHSLKRAGAAKGRGLGKINAGAPDGTKSLPEDMHLKGVGFRGMSGSRHVVAKPGQEQFVGVEGKASQKVVEPKKGLVSPNRTEKPVRKK